MFAHFAQETGEHNKSDKEVEEWRQGLAHLRELGCTDTSPGERKIILLQRPTSIIVF